MLPCCGRATVSCGREAGREGGTGRQREREGGRQAWWEGGRQAEREGGRQRERQTGRQAEREGGPIQKSDVVIDDRVYWQLDVCSVC